MTTVRLRCHRQCQTAREGERERERDRGAEGEREGEGEGGEGEKGRQTDRRGDTQGDKQGERHGEREREREKKEKVRKREVEGAREGRGGKRALIKEYIPIGIKILLESRACSFIQCKLESPCNPRFEAFLARLLGTPFFVPDVHLAMEVKFLARRRCI